jgi:hypothetical protein
MKTIRRKEKSVKCYCRLATDEKRRTKFKPSSRGIEYSPSSFAHAFPRPSRRWCAGLLLKMLLFEAPSRVEARVWKGKGKGKGKGRIDENRPAFFSYVYIATSWLRSWPWLAAGNGSRAEIIQTICCQPIAKSPPRPIHKYIHSKGKSIYIFRKQWFFQLKDESANFRQIRWH